MEQWTLSESKFFEEVCNAYCECGLQKGSFLNDLEQKADILDIDKFKKKEIVSYFYKCIEKLKKLYYYVEDDEIYQYAEEMGIEEELCDALLYRVFEVQEWRDYLEEKIKIMQNRGEKYSFQQEEYYIAETNETIPLLEKHAVIKQVYQKVLEIMEGFQSVKYEVYHMERRNQKSFNAFISRVLEKPILELVEIAQKYNWYRGTIEKEREYDALFDEDVFIKLFVDDETFNAYRGEIISEFLIDYQKRLIEMIEFLLGGECEIVKIYDRLLEETEEIKKHKDYHKCSHNDVKHNIFEGTCLCYELAEYDIKARGLTKKEEKKLLKLIEQYTISSNWTKDTESYEERTEKKKKIYLKLKKQVLVQREKQTSDGIYFVKLDDMNRYRKEKECFYKILDEFKVQNQSEEEFYASISFQTCQNIIQKLNEEKFSNRLILTKVHKIEDISKSLKSEYEYEVYFKNKFIKLWQWKMDDPHDFRDIENMGGYRIGSTWLLKDTPPTWFTHKNERILCKKRMNGWVIVTDRKLAFGNSENKRIWYQAEWNDIININVKKVSKEHSFFDFKNEYDDYQVSIETKNKGIKVININQIKEHEKKFLVELGSILRDIKADEKALETTQHYPIKEYQYSESNYHTKYFRNKLIPLLEGIGNGETQDRCLRFRKGTETYLNASVAADIGEDETIIFSRIDDDKMSYVVTDKYIRFFVRKEILFKVTFEMIDRLSWSTTFKGISYESGCLKIETKDRKKYYVHMERHMESNIIKNLINYLQESNIYFLEQLFWAADQETSNGNKREAVHLLELIKSNWSYSSFWSKSEYSTMLNMLQKFFPEAMFRLKKLNEQPSNMPTENVKICEKDKKQQTLRTDAKTCNGKENNENQNQPKCTEVEKQSTEKIVEVVSNDKMFCTMCGAQILRSANFCNFCGATVTYKKEETKDEM